ncbi:MAG: AAA family ATPase [Deltaproteobacteria bacterium RBG_16_71_12]|nr:MAG: AAA family ATPase [Deltaproteobacteria bacterium RBG_16_71_12]
MPDLERPRLLVVAGPNGSGKTTVTERGLRHEWFHGCEYVNPDNIARDVFGDWNSPDAVLKAATEADRRRKHAIASRQDLAFETVFSARDKVTFVYDALDAGYFVRLFFVGTAEPSINAARVARRVQQGGHDVPITKIIDRYVKSIANCAEVALDVDRLYLYDNSVDGADPRLVLRASKGSVTRRYGPTPEWMLPIAGALHADDGGGSLP